MFTQLLAIVRNTFLESIRQPIYIVLLLGQGLITALLVSIAAFSMSDDNKLFLDMCIGAIFSCSVVLAAFLATSVLSKEIDNKTVLTIVSKPIGRPLFVIGKYLGVTGAIGMATLVMVLYFLLANRHEVMSTVRDKLDGPVLVFSITAVVLSIGVGAWGNYFYGWVFNSTAALLLAALMLLAWALTLIIGKGWVIQPIWTDLQVPVLYALLSMLLAVLVLTAVAIAASTRFGQVMTLVICLGVFFLGLLGNYFVGRHAVHNETLAQITLVEIEEDSDGDFSDDGDTVFLVCSPEVSIKAGTRLYYGPNPGGLSLVTPRHTEGQYVEVLRRREAPMASFDIYNRYMNMETGELENLPPELEEQLKPAGLYVINRGGLRHARRPEVGDRIFKQPTEYNAAAFAAWTLLPNLQSFWLVDAVTQELPIPARHIGMVSLYALCCIVALLSLSVFLFQTREVG
jgi:ABC-type transport system involved in multi-copper enzyme maturation permease subunit